MARQPPPTVNERLAIERHEIEMLLDELARPSPIHGTDQVVCNRLVRLLATGPAALQDAAGPVDEDLRQTLGQLVGEGEQLASEVKHDDRRRDLRKRIFAHLDSLADVARKLEHAGGDAGDLFRSFAEAWGLRVEQL